MKRWTSGGLTGLLILAFLAVGGFDQSAADAAPGETTSAQAPRSSSPLILEKVVVEPLDPGPGTLCRLRVNLRNRGRHTASRFHFRVQVADNALEVYEDQLFLQPIVAGESQEILLFNFWSSEAGRPFPATGPLTVEVSLEAASWVSVELGSDGESRHLIGAVPGLPSALRLNLADRGESGPR